MPALTPILLIALQVGPNPTGGTQLGTPDELLERPARKEELNPTSKWLAQCLRQLEDSPARAHAQAQIRRAETSGAERVVANHCLGLAATELSLWRDARSAFLAAREETPADELSAKARFGTMAGNAALAGGDAQAAVELLAAAQIDARNAASATLEAFAAIDAARALVTLKREPEALAALENATRLEPEVSEGWLLKATLLRRLERLDEAQSAIERAIELAPLDAEIGLEAGLIAVLSGREDAARQSWESVIATQPDSLAAVTAKDYLEQLGPPPTARKATEELPPSM
ncbi:MAG: tetratricopeptide repeat protein [Pseudomonadota bacterium]